MIVIPKEQTLTIEVAVPVRITFLESDLEGSETTWEDFVHLMKTDKEAAIETLVDNINDSRESYIEEIMRDLLKRDTVSIEMGEDEW